ARRVGQLRLACSSPESVFATSLCQSVGRYPPPHGFCPSSVRCYGGLGGVSGSGPGFGRFGRVGGVQAAASLAIDRLRPWASLSMLWARQTRPHSWATLSSPRIRN